VADAGGAAPERVPEVSVVIVAWRSRDDVLACLRSLERDAGLAYEAIVVDDGSGDGTPEAVAREHPSARVIAKERNEGLTKGRNAALPLVRGRFVLMLDADTEVRPGALPALVAALERDPRIGLVGPRLVYRDGRTQMSCRRWPSALLPLLRRGPLARAMPEPRVHRRHMMLDDPHDRERPVVWVMGAAQMWRRELPALIGTYDERVSSYGGEDLDWCLRVWAAGLEVRYVPEAEIVHVWQQMTRKRLFGRASWLAFRDFYYLQWKHRALRRSALLADANA
jgi:N-acetylglucosaminyl-diphospho-decaprenol L-rhamnosyltransferase